MSRPQVVHRSTTPSRPDRCPGRRRAAFTKHDSPDRLLHRPHRRTAAVAVQRAARRLAAASYGRHARRTAPSPYPPQGHRHRRARTRSSVVVDRRRRQHDTRHACSRSTLHARPRRDPGVPVDRRRPRAASARSASRRRSRLDAPVPRLIQTTLTLTAAQRLQLAAARTRRRGFAPVHRTRSRPWRPTLSGNVERVGLPSARSPSASSTGPGTPARSSGASRSPTSRPTVAVAVAPAARVGGRLRIARSRARTVDHVLAAVRQAHAGGHADARRRPGRREGHGHLQGQGLRLQEGQAHGHGGEAEARQALQEAQAQRRRP